MVRLASKYFLELSSSSPMKNRWHSSGQPRKALATVRPRISPKMGAMGLGGAEGAIETHGLRRVFKTRKQVVEAVAGVDLTVQAGEIFGFLGPNGAGKTTTLRMLATLLPPSGGTARVAGCDLAREPDKVRKLIGYVSQAGGSDYEVVGRFELVFQGRLYGMSLAAANKRAAELIEMLELEICADRPVKTYSGGQKRRLDIGLGLVHDPKLLFLDEPTTGLDPQSRARVWDEVRRMHDRGTTVFLTTNYLDEADALCDRIAIIDYGKIVAEGTPEELKRAVAGDVVTLTVTGSPQAALDSLKDQPYVREGSIEDGTVRLYVDRGEVAMPAILRALDAAGLQLSTIGLHRPSLDDVFLRKTGRSARWRREAASRRMARLRSLFLDFHAQPGLGRDRRRPAAALSDPLRAAAEAVRRDAWLSQRRRLQRFRARAAGPARVVRGGRRRFQPHRRAPDGRDREAARHACEPGGAA